MKHFWIALFGLAMLARASQPVLIGIDTNPPGSEGYSAEAKRKWFQKALDAGMAQVSLAPTWKEVEKSPGKFTFEDLDFNAGLAREHQLPVHLNIRIIDTSNKSVPDSYAKWKFDDPQMVEKLKALIHAIAPRVEGQVRWIAIGNEIDPYLLQHTDEIPAYRRLLDAVMPTVRESFPKAAFTVNFTFAGLDQLDKHFRSILEIVDFFSVTYYPMNPDFTFRDPSEVQADFEKMFRAAGNKQVFFQELGYASSSRLNSSEEKQARFIEAVFKSLKAHRSTAMGAHFVWMSDIPQATVDMFGEYYKLPNSDNFKAFLGSLGYFQRDAKPKAAWLAFEREMKTLNAQ